MGKKRKNWISKENNFTPNYAEKSSKMSAEYSKIGS